MNYSLCKFFKIVLRVRNGVITKLIMINGNWEQVENMSDVIRIVSENISYEFANEVEKIYRNLIEEYYYEHEQNMIHQISKQMTK